MRKAVETIEPWYKNPWVWLIIGIPGLTVLGCVFTIYLAITHPDLLVSDASTAHLFVAGMSRATGLG